MHACVRRAAIWYWDRPRRILYAALTQVRLTRLQRRGYSRMSRAVLIHLIHWVGFSAAERRAGNASVLLLFCWGNSAFLFEMVHMPLDQSSWEILRRSLCVSACFWRTHASDVNCLCRFYLVTKLISGPLLSCDLHPERTFFVTPPFESYFFFLIPFYCSKTPYFIILKPILFHLFRTPWLGLKTLSLLIPLYASNELQIFTSTKGDLMSDIKASCVWSDPE